MRISFLQLVLLGLFVGIANAYDGLAQEVLNQRVTIDAKNQQVAQILNKISQQTGVRFMYSPELIQATRKVSLKAAEERLSAVLTTLLSPLKITYELSGQQILLRRMPESSSAPVPESQSAINQAQLKDVSGTVTDENGQRLPGVSVLVKGTSRGTTTDAQGNYRLAVSDDNVVLIFSFVGYESKEVMVGNQSVINLSLPTDNRTLNEVVVVGYGTQVRRDVTGSVSSISSEQVKAYPIVSADQALQGRAAGVQVFQTSGAPGGAVQVRIRGVNTTAGNGANQPLYVVDGIPLSTYNEGLFALGTTGDNTGASASNSQSPLSTINPADIESIEVLKDASATAIYGARAANGVVLITTKTGKRGNSRIEFNTYHGVQSLRREVPMINARERMITVGEQRRNNGTYGTDEIDVFAVNPYLYNEGTNWQREIFRAAPMSNYNLSVSGGTDKVSYLISGDYLQQDGIILNTYSNRIALRTNIDVQASSKLKIGTRTSLNYTWDNVAQTDNNTTGISLIFYLPPTMRVFDENGNYAGRTNSLARGEIFGAANNANLPTFNIVGDLMENERKARRYRAVSSVFAEYKLLPELTFKSIFGIDYMFGELRSFLPIWQRGIDRQVAMTVGESRPKNQNWVADQLLTYDKTIGLHKLNALVGFSAQSNTSYSFGINATGSTSNALNNLGSQTTINGTPSEGSVQSGIVSQFLRTNYSYNGRYLFTGTIRRDGSSRFGKNNQYGYFPSASVGWRVSEEPFMQAIKPISDLKLRASYGITGNQNIGDFQFKGLAAQATAVFGNVLTAGVGPYRFDNDDIRWERNKQFDVGIELGLFNNRLNFVADYYKKTTDGLLADFPISAISGVGTSVIKNVGVIENQGFEFAANAILVDKNDWRWTADFNISTNQNQVKSLGLLPFINGATVNRTNTFMNRTQPGQPIGAFYILETNGMYTTREEAATAPLYRAGANIPYFAPGDYKLVDQDKNGTIDDNDRIFYGSPFPDYYGGISTNVSYKGIGLDIVSSYQHGNLIYNFPRMMASLGEANMTRDLYDTRYRPTNPTQQTETQILRVQSPIMPINTFLEDGSFFRVRSVALSYVIPASLTKRVSVQRARIYAQANNFFVLTRYKGWDPEVNSYGSNVLSNGFDYGAYPQAKSVVFGLNLSF